LLGIRSLLGAPGDDRPAFLGERGRQFAASVQAVPVAALVPTTTALGEQAARAGRPGLLVPVVTAAVTGCAKTGEPAP
jgi:hypothetical protein